MQKKTKRIAALVTSLMMCASVFAEPALAVAQDIAVFTDVSAASSTAADSMFIYDELGQNISNGKDAYIYLDNSSVAGGKTQTTVTVKVSNQAGNVDDKIYWVQEASTTEKVKAELVSRTNDTLQLKLSAIDEAKNNSAYKSGTTYIEFSTSSGEVYRKLYVVIYQPSPDITVYTGSGSTRQELEFNKANESPLDGLEYGVGTALDASGDKSALDVAKEYAEQYYNAVYGPDDYLAGISAIANHKFQLNAVLTGTDKVQWKLYDGPYKKGIENGAEGSALAEITQDGVFTPKSNGTVTLMVKALPTLPYQCKETDTEEGVTTTEYINNAYTETFKRLQANVGNSRVTISAKEHRTNGVFNTNIPINYTDRKIPKFIQVNIIKENPAKSMKFINPPAGMQLGETAQLNLDMTPSFTGQEYTGATDVVEWTTSNNKVVTVDSKGQITAVGKGEATITANGENANVYTSCIVRVYSKATGVEITPSPASTRLGVPISLTATLSPDTAEDEIVWTSSDNDIATVEATPGQFGSLTQKAVVTGGTKTGTVTITATAKYSGVEAKCTVTVNDRIDSDSIDIYSVDADSTHTPIGEGENVDVFSEKSVDIEAVLTAKDGSTPDDKITWTVLNNAESFITTKEKTNNILTINAVSEGQVTVIAASSANPSIQRRFTVNVIRACNNVKIVNETGYTSLRIGESVSLTADLTTNNRDYPYNHDDKVKSWTSSNEAVATVSDNGTVTCKGIGTATITCTALSGVSNRYSITGFIPSDIYFSSGTTPSTDGQSLPTATISMSKKNDGTFSGTLNLVAAVQGVNNDNNRVQNIGNSRIVWTSSDESIATVDEKGVVTATAIGETTITAASGSKTTSALLSVTSPVNNFDVTIENCSYSPVNVDQVYTPIPVVSFNGTELAEGTDYTLEYSNNTSISNNARVTITGLGKYTGTVTKQFQITAKNLADDDITVEAIPRQQATGLAITPEPVVSYLGVPLVKDTDYTLRYSNNNIISTDTTKAMVTIQGRTNYYNTKSVEFVIYCEHPEDQRQQVSVSKEPTCTEAGVGQSKCKLCGTTFTDLPALGHDFVTTKVAATYDADGYTLHECSRCGESYKTDTVTKLPKTSLTNSTVTLSATSFAYTGSQVKPTVTVKNGSTTLVSGTDYTATFTNSVNAGTATITITGKNKYSGTIKKTYTIAPASITKATVTGVSNKVYTGKAITPIPVVKLGTKTLVKGTDYTVSYKNNKAMGKAVVTIAGKGNYNGKILKAFRINPKKATLKSVTSPKAKKMKVTYAKQAGVSGYEILYSTSSNFSKGKKTVTVKKAGTVTKTISKLTKGKTYYVKVRAFKTVGGTKYYGLYSAKKKVKIKKK